MVDSLGIPGGKLYPLLEPTMQKISQQLTQWLTFAATTEGGLKVVNLNITGLGSRMRGLAEAIGQRANVKTASWEWLEDIASTGNAANEMSINLYAAAISAVRHRRQLPDLVPQEVKKSWRLRRIRRSTAIISPIVATVVLGFTFLFNQVRNYTKSTLGAQQALSNIQTVVDANAKWEAEELRVSELKGTLDAFALTTPAWEGLFKEMSRLFASELRVTRYVVASEADGIHLRIDANVYTTPTGRDFDEVVEQTLLALDRSPFLARVQLINSTRFPADGSHVETGAMSINLELAYLRPKPPVEDQL
ncbi:MAG: hypothetical protein IPK83_08660 [Planctomycetes bacterium]|nr:hypothetical protein [Planctomycetota bacterium]